jgi:hypothetical protein
VQKYSAENERLKSNGIVGIGDLNVKGRICLLFTWFAADLAA